MNFDEIKYLGEELSDLVDTRTSVMTFSHMYRGTYKSLTEGKPEHTRKNHACLDLGYWCKQNALTNPIKALKYFKRKFI